MTDLHEEIPGQLALGESQPERRLDPTTRAILDLLNGDPIHDADRERILVAIRAEGLASGGRVDPNRVRERLTVNGSLVVNPRVLSGFYSRLASRGYLAPDGKVVNGSRGNSNKESNAWRLTRPGQVTA